MSSMNNRVVVVGNIGIDTNIYLPGDAIDLTHEANFTTNLDTVGQAGGYASRAYCQLGAQTAFIGCVGAHWMGEQIRSVLEADGINSSGLFIDPEGTSRSVNLVYPDGSRRNFYDGKNHMQLQPPVEESAKIFAGARLAHFNIPNWARQLLPAARERGLTIACDIQDVVNPADPYRQDFIRYADYLFFSAVNHPDPRPVIEHYLSINADALILATMGAEGCAVAAPAGILRYPVVQLDLPVVDTNGAGDAFAAGFLVSHVLEERGLEESVRRGQICASYKCAQRSTSGSMITRDLLEHYAASSG